MEQNEEIVFHVPKFPGAVSVSISVDYGNDGHIYETAFLKRCLIKL